MTFEIMNNFRFGRKAKLQASPIEIPISTFSFYFHSLNSSVFFSNNRASKFKHKITLFWIKRMRNGNVSPKIVGTLLFSPFWPMHFLVLYKRGLSTQFSSFLKTCHATYSLSFIIIFLLILLPELHYDPKLKNVNILRLLYIKIQLCLEMPLEGSR